MNASLPSAMVPVGMQAPTIHTPLAMGPLRLGNRLVALPVFTGYALPDGRVSPLMQGHYTRLAATGVAMVVVANVAVSPHGVTSRYNLRIDDDRYVAGLARLAKAIRDQGALAAIQLNHAGRFAKSDRPLLASPADPSNMVHHLSALKGFMHAFPFEKRFGLTRFFVKQISRWRRSMDPAEMDAVTVQFGRAARRAGEAGFDAIELHGANGYLLCEFLSPATNRRRSGLGGDLEGRATLPAAVVREVKRRLPPSVPLGFRLVLDEYVPGGIGMAEAVATGRLLEKAGVGYLSVAAGTFNSMFRPGVAAKMARPAYLRAEARQLTAAVAIPTIVSGRITTPDLANELLAEGVAHLIGLGRPLRVDGNWVKKSRGPAPPIVRCINCNGCLKRVILEQGFVCRLWSKTKQLKTHLEHMLLTRNDRSLWVSTDQSDPALFIAVIPQLFPMDRWMETGTFSTILFMDTDAPSSPALAQRKSFLSWMIEQTRAHGLPADAFAVIDKRVRHRREMEIETELASGGQGMVLMGRTSGQGWRERLFFRLRHKTIGQIAPNPHIHRIAVCIDFSDASLLALAFARRQFVHRPEMTIHFLHVLAGDEKRASGRWSRLIRVIGLDGATPLTMVPSTGSVAEDLLGALAKGRYGTVIMGKRGLSKIKRLLLGSVSRSVLRKIGQRTLFLVD